MPVDREKWTQPFTKEDQPNWNCSRCGVGIFELQQETLFFKSTIDSIEGYNHHGEEDLIELRFSCLFKCNNKKCNDVASISGTGGLEEVVIIPMVDRDFVEYFIPQFFNPSPLLFPIPEHSPENIKEEILKSFSEFWHDTDSAGNRIRASIEALLDYRKVKKTRLNKQKKRCRISLHERIENELAVKDKHLSERLKAIKWIGNAGSHSGSSLSKNDIFDAYDILESVLHDLFDDHHQKVKNLTKSINKKRRPISKQR